MRGIPKRAVDDVISSEAAPAARCVVERPRVQALRSSFAGDLTTRSHDGAEFSLCSNAGALGMISHELDPARNSRRAEASFDKEH
jgi:hypothetical protein